MRDRPAFSAEAFPPLPFVRPREAVLSGDITVGCGSGGLFLLTGRFSSPQRYLWLGEAVRSCVSAFVDFGPGLETSFLAFILFCTFLFPLCGGDTVALES
jgi:hypothetical protein